MAERFWAKVDRSGSVPVRRPDLGNCWIWLGAVVEGRYGRFNIANGLQLPAHAVAYALDGGVTPADRELDHLCLVKQCVRPSHLEPVAHVENLRRADVAYGIRTAVTHCPQNHEYTQENTRLYRGRRNCRACARIKERARRLRKKREQSR